MTEAQMTPAKATALRKPFPRESIGQLPKGGVMLDYVGHAAVTDRLLTVDPDWSWEPMAVDDSGLPALDRGGNLWIRLTVCGVTRIGVGDGKSAKECIGDALRNAAMRFGVALDLWAKENLVEFAQAAQRATDGPPPAPQAPPAEDPPLDPLGPPIDKLGHPVDHESGPMRPNTRGQMFALFNELQIAEDQQLPGINHILGMELTSRSQLTEGQARAVIKQLQAKKRQTVKA